MRRSQAHNIALLIFLAIATLAAGASAEQLDGDQRMRILMRVLTYDHRLEERQQAGTVFIGILFSPGDKSSVAEKDEVLAALGALKALKIKGYSLEFAAAPYADAALLPKSFAGRRPAALYVCGGLASAMDGIRKYAADSKTATMSGSEPFTQGGLAFAAVEKDGKGQIIVNLKAAKDQGLDLDASLLRLAIVLR